MLLFYVIYISFNEHGFGARIYTFTLDWYLVVLGDKPLVASLKWTLYLAIATVLSVIPMSLLYAKLYKKTQKSRKKSAMLFNLCHLRVASGARFLRWVGGRKLNNEMPASILRQIKILLKKKKIS